jgi:hypothetical protein
MSYVDKTVINTLNTDESNAWCGRSWNSIMLKAFSVSPNLIMIQDDTFVRPHFSAWFESNRKKYDFIWGPAGDQFFYLTLNVLRTTGWFDERFTSGYCGDADFLKRVCASYPLSKISVEESHDWGFRHNPIGTSEVIITDLGSKQIDPNYENAHWYMERLKTKEINRNLEYSQGYFLRKWGHVLNNNQPVINSNVRLIEEIDWYPWATKKYEVTAYDL